MTIEIGAPNISGDFAQFSCQTPRQGGFRRMVGVLKYLKKQFDKAGGTRRGFPSGKHVTGLQSLPYLQQDAFFCAIGR
jgi:hypothetical protein